MNNLSIVSLSDYIIRTFSDFAGHRISFGSANICVFKELLYMDKYFQSEPSAKSCNFDAKTQSGNPCTITISRVPGGSKEAGLRYSIQSSIC